MLPSILLIEDQSMFTSLLVPHLIAKYQVATAKTAVEALAQLQAHKFDVALLDLKLDKSPELAGLNLLPVIQQNGAQVIVVSAHCNGSAQLVCQRSGVCGYVDKAGSADELLPTIAAVLAGQPCLPADWAQADLQDLPELNNTCRKILKQLLENPDISNKELTEEISGSLSLVKYSIRIMLGVFACKTRHQLVNEARRRGYRPDLQLAKPRRRAPLQTRVK